MTLLSGLHPLRHGVRAPEHAPADEVELLAETLARAGYYGFAVTDGGWLTKPWGFDRGFASFDAEDQDFERSVERALEYVRHRSARGPWFGFLHTYDVHCPYDPPEPYASLYASGLAEPIEVAGRCGNPDFNAERPTPGQVRFLSDRYDGDVRRADDALARLFAALDELGLWETTLVIVTSDHGEEFGEHGRIGHEETLHREALHVPLLVAAPGLEPRTVETPVGLADLVPTVLELAGVASARTLDGRSLAPLLIGEPDPGRDLGRLSDLASKKELASWIEGDEHWIVDLADGRVRRFDWTDDRAELVDRAAERGGELPARALELRAALERARIAPRILSLAEVEAELRELGY